MNGTTTVLRLRALVIALQGALAAPLLHAAPQGGQVVAGQAQISQQGALTSVQQVSARAIVNWQSFNVGAGETVRFNQPDARSAILNRVGGNDPSSILGRISSNGQVFLINPNGILFGRTAQVDVGGLVASTANISDANFMKGHLKFDIPGKPGAQVINQGLITVRDAGVAALVGPHAVNEGVIQARLGKVTLAAGEAFVLDLYGDHLVNLIVDEAQMNRLSDARGRPLRAVVDQSGQITADGGRVELLASTASNLVDSLINAGGQVRATSFEASQGEIALIGDHRTTVTVSGRLDVSGEVGGHIAVTGGHVDLRDAAVLDASAMRGAGGQIDVGGQWQGKGALLNAQNVNVAQGAKLLADAGVQGVGGTVSVFALGDTMFHGAISARGGSQQGQGGQVEVSGKARVGFDGSVDASAANGSAGVLLIDPDNLFIGPTGGKLANMPALGDFTLDAMSLRRVLTQGTSVKLVANTDISVNAWVDGRLPSEGKEGGGLSLTAGRDVYINDSVVLNNADFSALAINGGFKQAENAVIATGNGRIQIQANGALQAAQLLTTGQIELTSATSRVTVNKAVSSEMAGDGLPGAAGSLAVNAKTEIALNGANVAGDIRLASGADTLWQAPLFSGGALSVVAGGSVAAGGASAENIKIQASDVSINGVLISKGGMALQAARQLKLDSTSALQSAGRMSLQAVDVMTLAGSVIHADGGFEASAGKVMHLDGDLAARGRAALQAGTSFDLNGNLILEPSSEADVATQLSLRSGGTFKHGAMSTLSSGSRDLILTARGDVLSLGQMLSTGAVSIESTAGQVSVARYIVGGGDTSASVASLNVDAGKDIRMAGVRSVGAVTLKSRDGDVQMVAGDALPLIDARTAHVDITAMGGHVDLGAVNAASLLVNAKSFGLNDSAYVYGDTRVEVAGRLDLGAKATLNVEAGGATQLNSVEGAISFAGQSVLRTSGSLTVRAATDVTMAGVVEGMKAITVNAGRHLDVSGDLVSQDHGLTLLAGQGMEAGRVTQKGGVVSAGLGALTISSNSHALGTGDIQVERLMALGEVTLNNMGGKILVSQSLSGIDKDHAGVASLAIDARDEVSLVNINSAGNVSLVSRTADITLAGKLLVNGPLTVDAGKSIQLTKGSSLEIRPSFESRSILSARQGDITTGEDARILSSGDLALWAKEGAIIIGGGANTVQAGLQVKGRAVMSLHAAGDVDASGALRAQGGRAGEATLKVQSDQGNIAVNDMTTTEEGFERSGEAVFIASQGDVVFRHPLGGKGTGYLNYEKGYQSAIKPLVGKLSVDAGNIETNGLNLDGLEGEPLTRATDVKGLSLRASDRIIVNDTIAVNKGDIELNATGPKGELLIGNSIYSRGIDPKDHPQKVGYAIDLIGRKIKFWDNSGEFAMLVQDVKVGKIIVANNAANYLGDPDKDRLVPVTDGSASAKITLNGTLAGVTFGKQPGNDIPSVKSQPPHQPFHLNAVPNEAETSLDRVPNAFGTLGLSVKVLTFYGANDQPTWSDDWRAVDGRSAAGVSVSDPAARSKAIQIANDTGQYASHDWYAVSGSEVKVQSDGPTSGTRVLIYPGEISKTNGYASFADSRGIAMENAYPSNLGNNASTTLFETITPSLSLGADGNSIVYQSASPRSPGDPVHSAVAGATPSVDPVPGVRGPAGGMTLPPAADLPAETITAASGVNSGHAGTVGVNYLWPSKASIDQLGTDVTESSQIADMPPPAAGCFEEETTYLPILRSRSMLSDLGREGNFVRTTAGVVSAESTVPALPRPRWPGRKPASTVSCK